MRASTNKIDILSIYSPKMSIFIIFMEKPFPYSKNFKNEDWGIPFVILVILYHNMKS